MWILLYVLDLGHFTHSHYKNTLERYGRLVWLKDNGPFSTGTYVCT